MFERTPPCKYCGKPVEKVRNRVKKDLGCVCNVCKNKVYYEKYVEKNQKNLL